MFQNNENRARLHDAIDKGIVRVTRAGTDMPPPIRGDAPMTLNPHGAPPVPPRASDTRVGYELGPVTPSPALQQTPTDALISGNVARALPRQAPGIAERVHKFLERK